MRAVLPRRLQLGRQLEPGQPGHLDVGDDDVRALRMSAAASASRARARLADDLEVALDVEQRAQRAEHHRLVLGHQHADHAGLPPAAARSGTHAGACRLAAVALERAGDLPQPLAHARQPAAFRRQAAAAVVAHLEHGALAVFGRG